MTQRADISLLTRRLSTIVRLKRTLPALVVVAICALIAWPTINNIVASYQPSSLPQAVSKQEEAPNTAAQPKFNGRDARNQPYIITATQGVELPENKIQLDSPKMVLDLNGGGQVTLTADNGLYDKSDKMLQLAGDVTLVHSDGYKVVTPTAWIDQTKNIAWSEHPTHGTGPTGDIVSEGFILKDNGHRVVFQGNSQLLLSTGTSESER